MLESGPLTGWTPFPPLSTLLTPGDIIHVQSRGWMSSAIRWFSTMRGEKKEAWPMHRPRWTASEQSMTGDEPGREGGITEDKRKARNASKVAECYGPFGRLFN